MTWRLACVLLALASMQQGAYGQATPPWSGPASVPQEEVLMYKTGPPECMYDPLNASLTFVWQVPCSKLTTPNYYQHCPTDFRAIDFQYYVNNQQLCPPFPQWFISSNMTLAPFSMEPMRIEDMVSPLKEPKIPRQCDNKGRCIEAYELNATIGEVDYGFTDKDGNPILTQVMWYDGTFPGPRFEVDQGVQTLVRVHNFMHCNMTSMKPYPNDVIELSYFSEVTAHTLHLHGSSSLAPFDGWTLDYTRPCAYKDYVYPNEKAHEPLWYHDHTMGITSNTAGQGLAGTYFVKGCGLSVPPELARLGTPQYLVITDQLFIQDEGSAYMNPSIKNRTGNTFYWTHPNGTHMRLPINTGSGGWNGGDHNLVNGRIWPVAKVQRKPYYFILHDAAVTRAFKLVLKNSKNQSLNAIPGNFWVVGGDGGLRYTPTSAADGLIIAPGERYQVVIDFSFYDAGEEIIMYNEPTPVTQESVEPSYCYSHLVMKFIVDDAEPAQEPFNPVWTVSGDRLMEDGQVSIEEMQAACRVAMEQPSKADIKVQITFNTQMENVKGIADQTSSGIFSFNQPSSKMDMLLPNVTEDWRINMMGKPGLASDSDQGTLLGNPYKRQMRSTERHLRAGRKLTQEYALNITGATLPQSMATNGWTTWWIYNPYFAVHPMHIHLSSFFVCGRKNIYRECPSPRIGGGTGPNCSNFQTGMQDYEMFVNKDVVLLKEFVQVAAIARFGPHQGKFQWHCHNLIHEDEGLMATFNSTSANPQKALIPNAKFAHGATGPDRYKGGWAQTPVSPELFYGEDPLVDKTPGSYIGENLAYADSMPPHAYKRTADGSPQPITPELLKKVLKRAYYKVFYPDGRADLSEPAKQNNWATTCSKPVARSRVDNSAK